MLFRQNFDVTTPFGEHDPPPNHKRQRGGLGTAVVLALPLVFRKAQLHPQYPTRCSSLVHLPIYREAWVLFLLAKDLLLLCVLPKTLCETFPEFGV